MCSPDGSFAMKTPEMARQYYDKWAEKYDLDCSTTLGYHAPKDLAALAAKYLKPEDLILVVGAGTGLEGSELHEKGFSNLHGHDGSGEMLKLAKQKNLFKHYYEELLVPDAQSKFPSQFYDATVNVGCFNPGALDARHLADIVRTVKPGGTLIIGLRESYVKPKPDQDYPFDFSDTMAKMVKDGKLSIVEEINTPVYNQYDKGHFFVCRVH